MCRRSPVRPSASDIKVAEWIARGDADAWLMLFDMDLQSLPPLPMTLRRLMCANNALTQLPELPPHLLELVCSRNRLRRLPALPPTLQRLCCDHNALRRLPPLPSELWYLYCHDNRLTHLPPLPARLRRIVGNNNQFMRLPTLPDGLNYLFCDGNPTLWTLPTLPPALSALECCLAGPLPPLPASVCYLFINLQHPMRTVLPCLPSLPLNLRHVHVKWITDEVHVEVIPVADVDLRSIKPAWNTWATVKHAKARAHLAAITSLPACALLYV
jgi:hypothetical protein